MSAELKSGRWKNYAPLWNKYGLFGSTKKCRPRDGDGTFLVLLHSAATAATATVAGRTGAAIGAANALFSAFLGLPDKPHGKTKYQHDHCYDDIIYHIHILLLSAESVLSLKLAVCPDAQPSHDADHHCHSDQTRRKACAQTACSDQGPDLIDRKANGVAYAQL